MDGRLKLSDAACDAAAQALAAASDALVEAAQDTAPVLTGVTDVGARVSEFATLLSVACGVLATAATSARHGVLACKSGSDDLEQRVAVAAGQPGSGAG